ncbi:MAG: hypothetical protein AAGF76_06370 [Pseudomonadota bacterium]
MKTIITTTLAVLIAVPALAEGRGPGGAGIDRIPPVLNGQLDLGGEITASPAQIQNHMNVDPDGHGQTTVEVTDQIDQVTGEVMATSTNVTTQINNAPVRAHVRVGSNRRNRSADVTAAAIGNTLSIVNGISQ